MYDGIGLKTPRGSGTNGHVERNLATVRNKLTNVSYLDLDEPQDSDTDDAPVKRKLLTFDRRHGDLICYRDLDDVDEPIMFTAINEPAPRPKKPLNKEILEHNRKRKIELRCFELSEELEDQGCVIFIIEIYKFKSNIPFCKLY